MHIHRIGDVTVLNDYAEVPDRVYLLNPGQVLAAPQTAPFVGPDQAALQALLATFEPAGR
jgi:hypothetical protein